MTTLRERAEAAEAEADSVLESLGRICRALYPDGMGPLNGEIWRDALALAVMVRAAAETVDADPQSNDPRQRRLARLLRILRRRARPYL